VALVAAGGADARALKMMWDAGPDHRSGELATMRSLHVDVLELAINWADVAAARPGNPTDPGDPAYQWSSATDLLVSQARAQHMRVAIQLVGAPGWANGGRPSVWAPTSPADYADFATAAARHFRGVHLWMIWGEPSGAARFQPLTPQTVFDGRPLTARERIAPHTYARLLDGAYGALKAQSSANLVVGGMSYVVGDIRAVNWVKNLRLPNGRPPRMDLYGHNPFSAREPNLANPPSPQEAVDLSDLARFQLVVDQYLAWPRGRRTIRLFLSELTIPTGPDPEFNFYTTPAVQARWIPRAFEVARAVNAFGLGWIHLYDISGRTEGGLIDAHGRPKPGYAAFRRA
jgi:hypothetical protein